MSVRARLWSCVFAGSITTGVLPGPPWQSSLENLELTGAVDGRVLCRLGSEPARLAGSPSSFFRDGSTDFDNEDALPALVSDDELDDNVGCGSELEHSDSEVEEGSFLQRLSCPGQGREDIQQLLPTKLASTPVVPHKCMFPGTAESFQSAAANAPQPFDQDDDNGSAPSDFDEFDNFNEISVAQTQASSNFPKMSKSRGKRRKTRRRKQQSSSSKLWVMFANVTELRPTALRNIRRRPEHVVSILDAHRRGERADMVEKELETAGWTHYLHSRAAVSASDKGTSGGTMILYRGSLQTVVPVEAFGKGSHQLPEGDLA